MGIKLTQKTLTTPVSIHDFAEPSCAVFWKVRHLKTNCTLWSEKKHYKHSSAIPPCLVTVKFINREHCIHMWLQEKRTHCSPSVSDTPPHLPRYLLTNFLCNVNKLMHIFQINVIIQFFVSSTYFEHHVFFIRRPFVHGVLCGMFFIHLCKQPSRWKDLFMLHYRITVHGTINIKLPSSISVIYSY